MRFTLRNKSKLIKAFGEDYYKLLISSLTAFAKSNREIAAYTIEGYTCLLYTSYQHFTRYHIGSKRKV